MFRRVVLLLLMAIVALVAVVGVNTLRHGSLQVAAGAVPAVTVDASGAADRLGAVIRLKTASSYDDSCRKSRSFSSCTAFSSVAPGLMVGPTDSRYFAGISSDFYRFWRVRATQPALERFHPVNERMASAYLVNLIRFYHEMLRAGAAE